MSDQTLNLNIPAAGDADAHRRRVLQIAFACDPHRSMECRNGWNRAVHAARVHDVTVLYGGRSTEQELRQHAEAEGVADRLCFLRVDAGPIGKRLLTTATTYYAGLRLWHRRAYATAKRTHEEDAFDLVHQTTYCGYREPGYAWKLNAPFVWGPIGGTHNFPLAYLTQLATTQAMWIELCRNAINTAQLGLSPRVRRAARRSELVLAATQAARRDLSRHLPLDPEVQLETAIDESRIAESRPRRRASEPLQILWAGRLKPWKALPLLLRALAKTPSSFDYRLRVMGVGTCEPSWKRLAGRLGVADRIEWVGWPAYADTWEHYRWADVFAFTSLRDTSGTGLLESLASGTPVVAVDHQGAADIVNESCGLLAPVGEPTETIDAFSRHLLSLAHDDRLWKTLSDGAIAEAQRHTWELQAATLLGWYESVWRRASVHESDPASHVVRGEHRFADRITPSSSLGSPA